MNPLVTVITPTFNSEQFISSTIESVLNQSFKNWELIVVDDNSSDTTCEIVKGYTYQYCKIKLIKLNQNKGAAHARNTALKNSSGRFIAYLDSDDLWHQDKLKEQIEFMVSNSHGFSCTSYTVINEDGSSLNKTIKMKNHLSYKGFLLNNLIQTVGVVVDTKIVPKSLLVMPNLRRRQDAATWLQILKSGYTCYGLNLDLAYYRRTSGSLSSNKFKAVKGVWYLYRKVEKLPLFSSIYFFTRYAILAVWKRSKG